MKPIFRVSFVAAATALLASCSSLQEGVVESKGVSLATTDVQPHPMYWVKVRGTNKDGATTTERVELFQHEWAAINVGDRISPRAFDPVQVPGGLRTRLSALESGKSVGIIPPKKNSVAKAHSARTARRAKPGNTTAAVPSGDQATSAPAALTPAQREARFREVQSRASEDPAVRDLKEKIHSAANEQDQARAMQNYRKGLYDKMRATDGSMHDLIDKAEAAAGKSP